MSIKNTSAVSKLKLNLNNAIMYENNGSISLAENYIKKAFPEYYK